MEESGHAALLIKVRTTQGARTKGEFMFRFEEAWTRHESYDVMVQVAWDQAMNGSRGLSFVCDKLKQVSGHMLKWSREVFGSISRQIKELKVSLVDAKERALVTGYMAEVRDLEGQLHDVYEREEIYYKQRSRVEWLMWGDQNTIFFPKPCFSPASKEHCQSPCQK